MMEKLIKAVAIVMGLLFFSLLACKRKEPIASAETKTTVGHNLKAERLYNKIDSLKGYFCDYPEECERYESSTYLEQKKFEDKIIKKRVLLAQNFLDSFPQDIHYFEVLKFYFNMNFEPIFINNKVADSLNYFLNKDIQYGTSEAYRRYRSLPVDMEARKEWLEEGYSLAQQFFQTDAPRKDKIRIENAILAREMRQAFDLNYGMEGRQNAWESRYWGDVDQLIWESFRLRMNALVEKYADMEIMAENVSDFIDFVSFKSPHLMLPYWEKFLDFTGPHHRLSDSKGFIAIHNLAKQNVEALKKVNLNKPLNFTFTSMDGNFIDLNDLRGKVVLIDFWSMRCPPCIAEMPHMQMLYEKYKDKGLEIIGLAAEGEEDKDRILEILSKQGATWPQRLDKGKNVVISYHSLFNISSYPTVWLLDKSGRLVDNEARGSRLEPLILEYLKLDN